MQKQKELNLYEIIYLVKSNYTDQELAVGIESYKDLITASGSQVMIENRGKRRLSYPIQGVETATYIQMLFLGNGSLVKKINTLLSSDDAVLRHMTTSLRSKTEL
jgi:small subunit ribosomal protein S6